MADINKALRVPGGFSLHGESGLFPGVNKPTSGGGEVAPKGSFYLRKPASGDGEAWLKQGAANDDWNFLMSDVTSQRIIVGSSLKYTTIQSSINSITDATVSKQYYILVCPGEYSETITGKNYVHVIAIGSLGSVVIKGNTGTLFTFPSTHCVLKNLKFELTPTINSQKAISVTAGSHKMRNCEVRVTSSTANITSKIMEIVGTDFEIDGGYYHYEMTATAAAANTHTPMYFSGNIDTRITNAKIWGKIGNTNDILGMIYSISTGDFLFYQNEILSGATNASHNQSINNIYFAGDHVNSEIKLFGNPQIEIDSAGSGGSMECVKIDSTGDNSTLYSSNNYYKISGGNALFRFFAVAGTGDIVESMFDKVAGGGYWGTVKTVFYNNGFKVGEPMYSYGIHTATTAGAANVNVNGWPNYEVRRSTSSLRYKENVSDIEIDTTKIYNLRPISFNSKCETDNLEKRFFGLAAEEANAHIPGIVELDKDGNPDAVNYSMLSVLLLKEIQKLRQEINILKGV
jgi:hypothetical protein